MSGKFSKSILSLDTYHAPQGIVEVNPARLRHWEKQLRKLQSVGYAIPSHYNHPDDLDLQEPIEMGVLQKRNTPAAEKTVGRLDRFKVAPDGKSAEIILETLTADAREKVEANAIYVSPVISPYFKDGAGNEYHDVIVAFDLVDHPVDYAQSGFVPAVAMSARGSKSKPFLLSAVAMADEKEKLEEELESPAEEKAEHESGAEPPDENEEEASSEENRIAYALTDVLAEAALAGISLPEDTTLENFIDRFYVACKALNAANGTQGEDEPLQEQSPMIATMSAQLSAMQAHFIKAGREEKRKALKELLASGRITPKMHADKIRELDTVKMSILSDSTVDAGGLDLWIKSKQENPAGTHWDAKQKTQKLSTVDPPHEVDANKEINEAVAALTARRKR